MRPTRWTWRQLSDVATYVGLGEDEADETTCASADEIVALMRSWKGTVPDVEVVRFDEHGDHVLAQLRQPAWGPDAEWYQVLHVGGDRITSLADFGSLEDARRAASVA